jgi:hypothetical protein
MPFNVNDMSPVVAPAGTLVVSFLPLPTEESTTASTPLNSTILLAAVVLKSFPFIVTTAPTAPLVGVKLVMVGVGKTVKFDALVNVTPLTVTEIVPLVVPTGTVVVSDVVVAAVTTAVVPLKDTTLLAGVVLKFVPVIITVAPIAPLAGLKDVKVGVAKTVKGEALLIVTPAVVIVMSPVVAPDGTDVEIDVPLAAVTDANVLLNRTTGLA